MKLHTKTTLLISVIMVAIMLATVLVISVRMLGLVQEDEQELARLQSLSLAEQISLMPVPHNDDDLARAVAQTHGARPNIVAVRVWELVNNQFVERITSAGSPPAQPITTETRQAIEHAVATHSIRPLPFQTSDVNGDQMYRVYAPIQEKGKLTGLVEVVERLNNIPWIVKQYAWNAVWLTLIAVGLITVVMYFSFRYFVYAPLEQLLKTISHRKVNEAATDDPSNPDDELGRASKEYNRMLAQLQSLTEERERQQEILQERVSDATQELQQRNEQLADANRELWETSRRLSHMERLAVAGQTAAQFAHEVGTPLSTISIHAEMLRETVSDDPAAIRRTNIITEQLERIERIVRGMLDRTRIEKPVLKPLDLRALIERICETMEPALAARDVHLMKSLADRLPSIEGNTDRLQQVFINLINNAIDAMPAGGELRLQAAVEEHHLAIRLVDTGCGMEAETRARLFDPLFTTKQRGHGTGFGLVVVKQIMDEHHGSIEVESELGRGSIFRLYFPLAVEQVSAAAIASGSAGMEGR